jgi:quinol monooxygenase YgiN
MVHYMLDIMVRAGCESEAVSTLSAIERQSRDDAGCRGFTWYQHEGNPYEFTLVESWESGEHLKSHLARDPQRWERFVPCLAGEPRSRPLRAVSELAEAPAEAELREFVDVWFDKLNRHVLQEDITPMVAEGPIEMVFPEATLRTRQEFADWYAGVVQLYDDEGHVLEQLRLLPNGTLTTVDLTTLWTARRTDDGSRLAMRAVQTWQVARSFVTGEPVIVSYRVHSLVDVY